MKIFSIEYFVFLIICVGIIIALAFILKGKSNNTLRKVFIIWSFVLFASHFLKQFVYWNFDDLHKSTAENICAVSTLLMPFILLIKKDTPFKDYLYFIGIIGGSAGILYPTEVLNHEIFTFETFRFYFCHLSLLAIPLLMAITGLYKPKFKNVVFIPLIFMIVQAIIIINDGALIFSGYYDGFRESRELTKLELFFSNRYCNNSFSFGPTDDMGAVGQFVGWLCPPFMKTDYLNVSNGLMTYWPGIWLLIPTYVLFTPLYLLITLPFNLQIFKKKTNKNEEKNIEENQ